MFTRLHAITLSVGLLFVLSSVEQTEMSQIIIQSSVGLVALALGAKPLFR